LVGSSQDAEDGLKKVLKEKPDLVLLDIMLPGMDGYQLLARLKANKETSHIPVIILSSLAGERDVIKGLEKGASDYVLKPFSPQILFFKIKKTLALKNEHLTDHHNL
jgi:DNA-binding response OmpR family regulator